MILQTPQTIGKKPLQLEELPEPSIGQSDLLVRVSVCGICRTDLHIIEGDIPAKKLPVIPGHQTVGKVVKCGKSCTQFNPGDRVGIAWLRQTCENCVFCKSGRENLCESSRYTGYHEDGGYAEFAVVPESYAYRIPGPFTDEEAAPLLCAGIIGFRALKKSKLPKGGRLGIFGFGSSAHIIIQIALYRGSKIFVVSRNEKHRGLAASMGAEWTSDDAGALPVKLDGAIVFAPAGEIVPPALRALNKGGTVVLAGVHMSPIPAMTYEEHLFHEKQLVSVESNTRQDGLELLKEAAKIRLRPRVAAFPLKEANEALLKLKRGEISGSGVLVVTS